MTLRSESLPLWYGDCPRVSIDLAETRLMRSKRQVD